MRCPIVLALLVCGVTALGPAHLCAQAGSETLTPELAEQMDRLFFEWDRLDRPGGSVAVIRDGQIIFQRSYGLASLELQVPNSDRTLFDVTTLAESFTATAVASLVADGRLSLDDAVGDHLPELAGLDPSLRVKHLVYHTSGLWDWRHAWRLSGGYLEDVITSEQILELLSQQPAPTYKPGGRFDHCVSNYTLLAEIVTRVTEESFSDWLWTHVLRPAGMTRSLVRSRAGESVEGSAQAYDYLRYDGYHRGTVNLAAPGAHGFYASIENMAAWLIGLEASFATDSGPQGDLLDAGVLNDGTPVDYVHGLHRGDFNGMPRLHAEGTWQGFNAALHYLPEQRFGVVILCNWISGWVNPVGQLHQITDLLLTVETTTESAAEDDSSPPADATTSDTGSPVAPAPEFTPDVDRYDQLVGDYRWEPGSLFDLVIEEDRLIYQQPGFRGSMTELTEDHFVLDGYPYYFSFQRDEQGRAASCLIEHEGDPDVTAPRIELAEPGPEDLEQLTGDYVSPELHTEYSVLVVDGNLLLSHRRLGRTRLEPEAIDHFTARSAPFRLLEFLRDDEGRVSGFGVDSMNLVFHKGS